MIYISSQPFLWLLSDGKRSAVLVILSGASVWTVRTWYFIGTPSLEISCSHAACAPGGRGISPLRSAAVKMMGRSHLYFRHRYSLLQASFLFLHSSPPGGDFLIGWGIAAGGNGRISEHALDGASCILSVNIEFF